MVLCIAYYQSLPYLYSTKRHPSMKKHFTRSIRFLTLLCLTQVSLAQETDQQLSKLIFQKDSLFWQAYNNCDIPAMMSFFADDVEFYHDKGGITFGTTELATSFEKNICSNRDSFILRREAVEGSIKVFPLRKAATLYGAVITGEHIFNVKEKMKKERAEGLAKFTHIWLLKDGSWKMNRVISYDHGPAPYRNKRTLAILTPAQLSIYAGRYEGDQTKEALIQPGNGILLMLIGKKKIELYPEREHFFFIKERDITFEFIKEGNIFKKLIIRERDEIAEELNLVAKK